MDEGVLEMARQRYGYGRWGAPYWFIGLEEGMAPDKTDGLLQRAKAWRHLGGRELDDCPEFHRCLGETRWHGLKPKLQPTWRPLILLLLTFAGRSTNRESLREYQRDKWGMLNGETCLIELSGLAAPNLSTERDRSFVNDRIDVLREKIRQYSPKLVVMYGLSRKESWERLAGGRFPDDGILMNRSTIMAVAKHPTSYGSTNDYWTKLGEALRERRI